LRAKSLRETAYKAAMRSANQLAYAYEIQQKAMIGASEGAIQIDM